MKSGHAISKFLAVAAVLILVALCLPGRALAHCDTMDGPVVKAAQRALATRNVNLVLIWVQKKDEPEIRDRFRQTLDVRRLSRNARKLADAYFFETVVRLHRAGEGEPYTGIEPAGTDLGPVIPVADKALLSGSLESLLRLFPAATREDIQVRFSEVIRRKSFNANEVEAGREYVKNYVSFMHYVEHLYEETRGSAHGFMNSRLILESARANSPVADELPLSVLRDRDYPAS